MDDVKRYVKGYEKYQANKPDRLKKTNYLHPNEIPNIPWDTISIDIIGPLLTFMEHNGILVTVDRFFKMAWYIPINMKISSWEVAQALWNKVFKDVGIPKKILSDRGLQFISNFIKELCLHLEIEWNPSTAYHPQTNGQTKWINQEMEQYLRLLSYSRNLTIM